MFSEDQYQPQFVRTDEGGGRSGWIVSGFAWEDSAGVGTGAGTWNIHVCLAWDRLATENKTDPSKTAAVWASVS